MTKINLEFLISSRNKKLFEHLDYSSVLEKICLRYLLKNTCLLLLHLFNNNTFTKMKNILTQITFSIIFLFSYSCVSAQKLSITDGTTTYEDQEHPCIVVQIEPDTKDVKDEMKDWMKDKKDVKLRGFGFLVNKDVLTATKVNLPEISSNEMDFYAEVLENGEVTEMKIFGSFGYNIHISKEKYPAEYRALKNMTLNFLSDYLPKYYQDKIEDTQELLSDLKSERRHRR